MQFIKKLVILTGKHARGTLILEKNGFGVWGKLNLFDVTAGEYKLVVISGDELLVINVNGNTNNVKFEMGEVDYAEIHAALLSDKVVMYGSNCAKKLSEEYILNKVSNYVTMAKKQAGCITFSSTEQKIDEYFKQIAPPRYNDFAIAEKNYYPAYVTIVDQAAVTKESLNTIEQTQIASSVEPNSAQTIIKEQAEKKDDANCAKDQSVDNNAIKENATMMPFELEQKYLSLMSASEPTKARQKDGAKTDACLHRHENASAEQKGNDQNATKKQSLKDMQGTLKPTGRQATYFERCGAMLDKLFSKSERFLIMESIIPGSRFVKINYDSKRFYIVGTIGSDYICYGVPSTFSPYPPEPLGGYARWLPLCSDKPTGDGFWMMYQDGITGKTLKGE